MVGPILASDFVTFLPGIFRRFISKTAAGAATGAVMGAVAGPVGAVVGGLIGAALGKRAESEKPIMPAIKRGARQAAAGAKVVAKPA